MEILVADKKEDRYPIQDFPSNIASIIKVLKNSSRPNHDLQSFDKTKIVIWEIWF